jgi:glycogen debranching enzyme
MSEMHHKDAAYHNGAIWLWLSGAFVHAGVKLGLKESAFLHTKELVNLILKGETLGTLPELLEPLLFNNKPKFSGTFSQAWSVSEFIRSFYKDYLGITLDVPNNKIYITPNLPRGFKEIDVRIPFGNNDTIGT